MHPRTDVRAVDSRRSLLAAFVLSVSSVACSTPSEPVDEEPAAQGETSFQASPATREELGVERWDIDEDDISGSVIGRDADGNIRAQVRYRAVDVEGARWVEVHSATDSQAAFRFRVRDGQVLEAMGADSLREPAWDAAAFASADFEQAGARGLTGQSLGPRALQPQTPQLVRHDARSGACLIFVGNSLQAVGTATGNDAIQACGQAATCMGHAMACSGR